MNNKIEFRQFITFKKNLENVLFQNKNSVINLPKY